MSIIIVNNLVYPRSCGRLISRCKNDTNCSMAMDNYQKSCENIRNWNTSSAMPMCSEECKKSMNDLGMNPIARPMRCCRCDNGDKKCASERRNIGFFCGVDLNNAKDCQNDQRMCVVESPNAPITLSHFSKFSLIIEAKRRHRLQIHCLFILILHSRMFWKALDYITS